MLNLKTLTIRNFRSYGDYDTVVNLYGLGPVFIMGLIEGTNLSCGAGKSSIADAITWVLFGRLPSKDKPADNVINHFTGCNCVVKIETIEGYTITRTRGVNGHNDLFIHHPNGTDVSDSTNQNAQQHLNKLFGLDYEIFSASVFFAQFGKPFLELPDTKRKKMLERLLGLTKFDFYAEVAKEKCQTVELDQTKYVTETASYEQEVLRLSKTIESNNDEQSNFEKTRKNRITKYHDDILLIDKQFETKIKSTQELITIIRKELSEIRTYDLVKLEKDWDEYQQRIDTINQEAENLQSTEKEITGLETKKTILESQINGQEETHAEIDSVEIQIKETTKRLNEIIPYNLDNIRKTWAIIEEIDTNITTLRDEIIEVNNELIRLKSNTEQITNEIEHLEKQKGTICPTCKQPIQGEHVHSLENPLQEKLNVLKTNVASKQSELSQCINMRDGLLAKRIEPEVTVDEAELSEKIRRQNTESLGKLANRKQELLSKINIIMTEEQNRKDKIKELDQEIIEQRQELTSKSKKLIIKKEHTHATKPAITMSEAQLTKKQYDAKQKQIEIHESSIGDLQQQRQQIKENIRDSIVEIENEVNPYTKIIDGLNTELEEVKNKRLIAQKRVEQYNILLKHFDYIRSAYSDRRKIKAHTLTKMIPYFNERIRYYLNAMGCNFPIEFNSFLQIKCSLWPYELWSGGERRKIDLAIMFAQHDLYVSIHDQQCNVMVFDEVDGRLDGSVQEFVNLLFKEFVDSNQQRTILVISHREEMRDAFPTKILVKKTGPKPEDLSYVEEVR
jgi:DNA repair exonuclease SbcCD ATPase subunit